MNAETPSPVAAPSPFAIASKGTLAAGSAPLAAICGALALTASMLNFLDHNNYTLLQPEVFLLVTGLVALAAVAGCLYAFAGKFGRIGMEALLVVLFVDLHFNGTGALVAALFATVILNRYAVPLLGMVSAAVLATTIVSSGLGKGDAIASPTQSGKTDPNLPVLLHLILDEHLGVEGFRGDFAPAARMGDDLKAFYTQRGFRLFGGAYSEHRRTVNAIPQILNFGETQPWRATNIHGIALTSNRYFDRLRALRYQIRVYQTDFLDYCNSKTNVETCEQTPKTGLAAVSASPLPVRDRAFLVAHGFLSLSMIMQNIGYGYDLVALIGRGYGLDLPLIRLSLWSQTSSIGAVDAFDGLIADLHRAEPGQAYFAHLLFPHYPYVTDQRCALKRVGDWKMRNSPTQSWETRQIAYFDQLRCAMVKVDAALEALTDAGLASRSIVIVHGDHGSRISENEPTVESIETLNDDDLISHHSTLFAVRSPGMEPRYESKLLPVPRLLHSLAMSEFRSAEVELPQNFTPTIALENQQWKPVQPYNLPAQFSR